jgi:hypothetical protein
MRAKLTGFVPLAPCYRCQANNSQQVRRALGIRVTTKFGASRERAGLTRLDALTLSERSKAPKNGTSKRPG